MEIYNSYFTASAYDANRYFTYSSPPHIYNQQTCTDTDTIFTQTDEALQMQHNIRFPTPPHTPPKNTKLITGVSAPQLRTQSVIMKVGHVQDTNITLEDSAEVSQSGDNLNEFVCNWSKCCRCFETLELLAAHVTQEHAVASVADGLYYCRWTGCVRTDRGFNARYKMLVHVRTHTKEKPHQCQLCDKKFSRAENLKIHIRSHSGEKPYICTYEGCHKAYSNSSDRFKHTRTHSMEKPYMCKVPGCQKRYTDPSSLRKHVKTFKHALQMIDEKPVVRTESSSPTIHTQNNSSQCGQDNSTLITNYIDKIDRTPTTYLCGLPTTNYYMGMGAEDFCHIKASQFECYYDAAPVNTASYWLTDNHCSNMSMPYQNSYPILQSLSNFKIDTDVEAPLDLRIVNRKS